MRKEIKSKSKRKWIVGGAMLFGGIALLTTGFATWVVGTQIRDQQAQTQVTIDTVDNQTLILSASLTNSDLYIGEPTVTSSEGNFYPVTVKDGSDTDFEIVIHVEILKSKTVAKPTNITLAIDAEYTNADANVVKEFEGTPVSPMTHEGNNFVELNTTTLTIEDTWVDQGDGNEKFTYDYTVNLLKWGDFFKVGDEYVSPTEYYKAQYVTLSTADEEYKNLASSKYSAFTSAAETELKEMRSMFFVEDKTTIIPLKLSI